MKRLIAEAPREIQSKLIEGPEERNRARATSDCTFIPFWTLLFQDHAFDSEQKILSQLLKSDGWRAWPGPSPEPMIRG